MTDAFDPLVIGEWTEPGYDEERRYQSLMRILPDSFFPDGFWPLVHELKAIEEDARRPLLETLRRWAAYIGRINDTGDWACIECRPQSDILIDGFRCVWHEARDFALGVDS